MILNLTPDFEPLGAGIIDFEAFQFKGGEPHIKIRTDIGKADNVRITQRINSFNDFGLLLLTIDALKRMDVGHISVFIPYFPAARQDRVMIPGEPLSVKVYADILNNAAIDHITVFDPHSEVTPAVINNCSVIPNHKFVELALQGLSNDTLIVAPDGGALKKIYKLADYLGGKNVIECSKSRDVETGKLTGFKIYADDLDGKDCLIVDDICDGGATFTGLAEALQEKNPGKLYMAVSHGIFSNGIDDLARYFERIYTTDSFQEIDDAIVEQIKLRKILR